MDNGTVDINVVVSGRSFAFNGVAIEGEDEPTDQNVIMRAAQLTDKAIEDFGGYIVDRTGNQYNVRPNASLG